MSDETCKAALNIAGEHYPCDWPTDAHTNVRPCNALADPHEPHFFQRGIAGIPGPIPTTSHLCPGTTTTDQRATGREKKQK